MGVSEQGFGRLSDKYHGGGRRVTLRRVVHSLSPSDPGDTFRLLLPPQRYGPPGMLVFPIKGFVWESIDVIDDACFARWW